jgi:hypothetical protein
LLVVRPLWTGALPTSRGKEDPYLRSHRDVEENLNSLYLTLHTTFNQSDFFTTVHFSINLELKIQRFTWFFGEVNSCEEV